MAVFWGALRCDFVNYDDPAYVTSNPDTLHGLTSAGVVWAFETGAASNWHPLTWLSHMADIQFYGLKPAGHHLTSLLLHAANAVLLFLILNAMTGALWRSAVVAAIFALHPLRVESVVWISERKDVLSTLFWMLTVWTYFKYQNSKSRNYYAAAVVCFACGLMAKPMLVTLPFVLLLLDYWPLRREMRWGLVFEKIPFFILAAASSVVTFVVQRRGGAVSPLTGLPLAARIGNAFISYVRYLAKFFWPARLSVLYPHPGHWPVWQVACAALLLAAITAGVIWRGARRTVPGRRLVLVFGDAGARDWAGAGGNSVDGGPLQLFAIGWNFNHGRLGSIGLLARRSEGKWILGMAGGLAIMACMVLTPIQVQYWHDSDALFEHAIDVTKNNYLAYNNLGYFLSNRGEAEQAMLYYKSALQINPNYDEAHNNLGFALAQLGRYQEATNEYIKALSINPRLTEAHNNLGNALGNLGFNDAAIHNAQVALEEDPRHADAHNNYGIALAMSGHLDEAIAQFRLAVLYKENYASAHSDLGNALALKGDLAGAIQEYQACLRINSKDPQAHNNLANVLAQQGKLDDAAAQYRTALELKPENPEAHFNFGCCLVRQGRRAEAAEQFHAALAQRPNYPAAQQQLEALEKTP